MGIYAILICSTQLQRIFEGYQGRGNRRGEWGRERKGTGNRWGMNGNERGVNQIISKFFRTFVV